MDDSRKKKKQEIMWKRGYTPPPYTKYTPPIYSPLSPKFRQNIIVPKDTKIFDMDEKELEYYANILWEEIGHLLTVTQFFHQCNLVIFHYHRKYSMPLSNDDNAYLFYLANTLVVHFLRQGKLLGPPSSRWVLVLVDVKTRGNLDLGQKCVV